MINISYSTFGSTNLGFIGIQPAQNKLDSALSAPVQVCVLSVLGGEYLLSA